jgi:hypothetical protein
LAWAQEQLQVLQQEQLPGQLLAPPELPLLERLLQ